MTYSENTKEAGEREPQDARMDTHQEHDTAPSIFQPHVGSIAWKVCDFLLRNPEEELTVRDVAVKFECDAFTVRHLLARAVLASALKAVVASRSLTYSLGDPSRMHVRKVAPPRRQA